MNEGFRITYTVNLDGYFIGTGCAECGSSIRLDVSKTEKCHVETVLTSLVLCYACEASGLQIHGRVER